MNLLVDRFVSDSDATLSNIFLDGAWICFGLEDEYRVDKVPKETRIPEGHYDIRLQASGRIHNAYATRFPGLHRGTLMLQNVPGFTGVAIHIGNHDDDTDGCILVGLNATTHGEFSVPVSSIAYKQLYAATWEAARRGELFVTITDNDR